MLCSWFFVYRYYKELSYITNNRLFLNAFICKTLFVLIVSLATTIYYVYIDVAYIAIVCGLLNLYVETSAWVRTKEIRKSYSAVS